MAESEIAGWVENDITLSHKSSLPVYDSIAVQEHERRRHLGGVEAGSSLVKLPGALDLKHQVASVHVLHDEEEAVLEKWNTQCQIGKKKRNPLGVKGQKSLYYQYFQARILRFTISLDILKKFCSGITFLVISPRFFLVGDTGRFYWLQHADVTGLESLSVREQNKHF